MNLKFLLSYHYFKNQDLDKIIRENFGDEKPRVFIDSGAFSAFTQGVEINLRDYADWVKRWRHWITTYSNLDAIGDAEQTRVNQLRLQDLGLDPLPVFHTGEPWHYLEWYIERYQYIALGGMVPYALKHRVLMPWLIRAFKMAQGRSVYHGFGCTAFELLQNLPWYSVDSSTWAMGIRYGSMPILDHAGRIKQIRMNDYQALYKHAKQIRALGFDPEEFSDNNTNDKMKRDLSIALAMVAHNKAEQWLQQYHGSILMIGRPEIEAGLHMYLAVSSMKDMRVAYQLNRSRV
jgi:hypothetical protein